MQTASVLGSRALKGVGVVFSLFIMLGLFLVLPHQALADTSTGTDSTVTTDAQVNCPTGNAAVTTSSLTITDQTATGTFSIAPGCNDINISLASYKALTPTFTLPQTLFDSSTGNFSAGGPYTFTAKVAPCFYQVDLVVGPVIVNLTPDNLYGDKKLQYTNAGTVACDPPPPHFPGCMSLSSAPGDMAHYPEGMHQIAGGPLLEGSDDVYSLIDGNAVQCFCPPTGMGIQTNWWKTDGSADGAIVIDNGLSWGLADARYLAINSYYICNPPVLPNCQKLLAGGPGDLAHYTDGLHQIAGGELLSGADDVYSYSDGNAMQCFCPPTGAGIQTQWWKTDMTVSGWIKIDNGLSWGLSDGAYLALNTSFDCPPAAVSTDSTSGIVAAASFSSGGGGGGGPTQPVLTVTKVVVNNFNGKSVVADFILKVNDTVVTSGVATSFAPGTYAVTETGPTSGYNGVFTGDCDSTGHITMAFNTNYSCTLTNSDIAPAPVIEVKGLSIESPTNNGDGDKGDKNDKDWHKPPHVKPVVHFVVKPVPPPPAPKLDLPKPKINIQDLFLSFSHHSPSANEFIISKIGHK